MKSNWKFIHKCWYKKVFLDLRQGFCNGSAHLKGQEHELRTCLTCLSSNEVANLKLKKHELRTCLSNNRIANLKLKKPLNKYLFVEQRNCKILKLKKNFQKQTITHKWVFCVFWTELQLSTYLMALFTNLQRLEYYPPGKASELAYY